MSRKRIKIQCGERVDGVPLIYECEKDDYRCPWCGNKDLWVELGEGDYYVGQTYYCLTCMSKGSIPDFGPSEFEVVEAAHEP